MHELALESCITLNIRRDSDGHESIIALVESTFTLFGKSQVAVIPDDIAVGVEHHGWIFRKFWITAPHTINRRKGYSSSGLIITGIAYRSSLFSIDNMQ